MTFLYREQGDRIKVRLESKAGISKHWNSCQGRLSSTMLRNVGACISGHFPSRSLPGGSLGSSDRLLRGVAGCWGVCHRSIPAHTGYCRSLHRMTFIVSCCLPALRAGLLSFAQHTLRFLLDLQLSLACGSSVLVRPCLPQPAGHWSHMSCLLHSCRSTVVGFP